MFVLREQECLVGVMSIEQKAGADVEPTTRHLIGECHHLAQLARAGQARYNLSPQSPEIRSGASHLKCGEDTKTGVYDRSSITRPSYCMWVAWVVLAACKRFPLDGVNAFISLTNSNETKLSCLMVESITQLYHVLRKLSGATRKAQRTNH